MSQKNHEYAALVTDLGFCLKQVEQYGLPERVKTLFEERVSRHETELGIANFTVASTAEVVPLTPADEQELVPLAA